MKQTAHLENWSILIFENGDVALCGVVNFHPKLEDGIFITTSRIVKLSPLLKKCESLNTIYELGHPSGRGVIGTHAIAADLYRL